MYGDGLVRMGWGMKQLTLATVGFERYAKTTRRAAFLAEMEQVVPWSALCGLIEPFYPNPAMGGGRSGSSRCCASIWRTRTDLNLCPGSKPLPFQAKYSTWMYQSMSRFGDLQLATREL